MSRRDSILIAALFGVVSTFGGCGLTGCADLQPLKDHIGELESQQAVTQRLVQRLVQRLAAALVQVEEARKELARLAATEGR